MITYVDLTHNHNIAIYRIQPPIQKTLDKTWNQTYYWYYVCT